MRIIDLIKMGLRNLFRRKARTMLTIIGVIIGTVSIVIMVSVGIGMNQNFDKRIMEDGSMSKIYIQASDCSQDENGEWKETSQKLDESVIQKIKSIEHVRCITPYMYSYGSKFMVGKYYSYSQLIIIDIAAYEDLGYPALEDGTYPTKEESKDTIYYGSETLSTFRYWSGNRAQEKTIDDINKVKLELQYDMYQTNKKKPYSFVPATKKKIGALSEGGYSETDWSVVMDIDLYKETMRKYANTLKIDDRKKVLASLDKYDQILINVDNLKYVTEVQKEIEKLGYKSQSSMTSVEQLKEQSNMLQLVLGAIGAVAMLVSAINIANTMIMSIYERTREIGIMKVLGCKVPDVRKLFLFEAGMIGLIGGIIGILLSYGGSMLINKYGSGLLGSIMEMPYGEGELSNFSVIPIWLPFAAALFGMAVGVVSGFIPAVKATRISAIEAMKNAE